MLGSNGLHRSFFNVAVHCLICGFVERSTNGFFTVFHCGSRFPLPKIGRCTYTTIYMAPWRLNCSNRRLKGLKFCPDHLFRRNLSQVILQVEGRHRRHQLLRAVPPIKKGGRKQRVIPTEHSDVPGPVHMNKTMENHMFYWENSL